MAAGTPVPYNNARDILGEGSINFGTATIKAILVSSAYTPDNDAHTVIGDVTNELAGNGYARQTLGTKTWTKGTNKSVLSSAAVEFTASGGSLVARRMILFIDSGVPGTSYLLSHVLLDSTPADVTAVDGEKIRVTPHATDGWLYV